MYFIKLFPANDIISNSSNHSCTNKSYKSSGIVRGQWGWTTPSIIFAGAEKFRSGKKLFQLVTGFGVNFVTQWHAIQKYEFRQEYQYIHVTIKKRSRMQSAVNYETGMYKRYPYISGNEYSQCQLYQVQPSNTII